MLKRERATGLKNSKPVSKKTNVKKKRRSSRASSNRNTTENLLSSETQFDALDAAEELYLITDILLKKERPEEPESVPALQYLLRDRASEKKDSKTTQRAKKRSR